MTAPLLEVNDLKLHFPIMEGVLFQKQVGSIRAVDGISFHVNKGETLGLVGESGCGKSTAIRAISMLYPPTAGQVLFEGNEITHLSKMELLKIRKGMQIIFQDPYASLNPRMTVGNIISEPMEIYSKLGMLKMSKQEISSRVEMLLERMGLSRFYKNRFPHEFSGGQRQRIGIARSLALQPKIILADEPVSALDVSIQSQILNLMKELQGEFGLTYIFISHDLSVIEYISDRIAVMYLGKIVEIADADTLYRNPQHPYTKALLSAAPVPDPQIEKNRQRIILKGDVPSPDVERKGCYFCDRCPISSDRCFDNIPEIKATDPEHYVACFKCEDPS
ncbi:MAG: ATP-binding cassette domain-containing protein [SAR324 cluster bacterium]|nr:ATP-binding cassette domain-containing protein [SAR324 cluster bacterium]